MRDPEWLRLSTPRGKVMTDQSEAPFLRPDISYGDYLDLGKILCAQHPRSDQHDELLFIIIHQTSELWMKLSVHELEAARSHIISGDLGPALKMIARVSRIQAQMIQSWDVLATLTPSEYNRIRPSLGQSSGFQSYQYRMLDFILGLKNSEHLRVHEGDAAVHAGLKRLLETPSLYDETLRLLERRGFAIPVTHLQRDWTAPYGADDQVEAAWLTIYRDPEGYWDLYELAEKLVDLEYRFQQWRFAHMKTVERIIGFRRGTGGSDGVAYLNRALETSFFPELFKVRTNL
jgi:tryptophan 2,3-dioxygenase